jgi:hypothetical protein
VFSPQCRESAEDNLDSYEATAGARADLFGEGPSMARPAATLGEDGAP